MALRGVALDHWKIATRKEFTNSRYIKVVNLFENYDRPKKLYNKKLRSDYQTACLTSYIHTVI